jgi:TIGR03009 family protein
MISRRNSAVVIVLCLVANSLWAQAQSEAWPRPNPIRPTDAAAGPDQPVNPQIPTLERRQAQDATRQYSPPGQTGNQTQPLLPKERLAYPLQVQQNAQQQPAQPPAPPFTLTPQEDAQLDRVLKAWELKSKDIKTFDCSFKRWEYDPVFAVATPNADPNAPVNVDLGILKYGSPDKGVFRVMYKEGPDGKPMAIEEDRADHWICDGKSVYQYIPKQKKLVEHKLPPDMQGKAIVDGPLPFLFGAEAAKLRQRYFLRVTPSPPNMQNVVCLEAYPRFQQDAANFSMATLMLTVQDMVPRALQIFQPNGKSKTSYEFYNIVTNDPLKFFQGNPFQAYTPRGWEKIVDDASQQQQAGRPHGSAR